MNLKSNILRSPRDKYQNSCFQDCYIIKILPETVTDPVPRVMDTNTTGNCYNMDIAFQALTYKYQIGDMLVAKVFNNDKMISASTEEPYYPALCILKSNTVNNVIKIGQFVPLIIS